MKNLRPHIARWVGIGCLVLASNSQAQDTLQVHTPHLQIGYAQESGVLLITVLDIDGQVAHHTAAPALYLDKVRQRDFERVDANHLINDLLDVRFETLGPRAIAVTWAARYGGIHDFDLHLRSDDETRYYGTGERYNALNQRGYTLPMVTDDRYGNKGVGSHKPMPFVMSSQGFGIWVDSYAPGHFDLSATERFTSKLQFSDKRLRIVFLAGPTMPQILEVFTGLTGRSPVPPPWAFGLWKSRDVHHNQDSVMVDLDKLRRYQIPASVLVLDSPWETGYNDFEVNTQQFPDAEMMLARIQEMGFYLCLWLTPFINSRNVVDMAGITEVSSNFAEAAQAGHLVEDSTGTVAESDWWKGRGGLVDFTDPAAVDWWMMQMAKTKATGVRAFKADDGEGNFVPDAVFHDGTTARKMKNRYAVLYDSVMQAYVDEHLGGDGVLITRTGYTGTQRYPFAWAGDNRGDFSFGDGLPSVILAGQNAALSGLSLWGSDIAGYAGTPSKEVFIRWTQFGAFSPFMQVHMTSNLGPWDFDAETLRIFQHYARLRTRLFPYLYQAVHETARTGLPVIRPMPLAFPDDAEAHRHIYQYLYGPDLLVAPMYQPGTQRAVYLPAGTWYDYWTGQRHDGPQTIVTDAPLETMPLFVRAGAILPLLPADVQTLITRHATMAPDIVALDDRRILHIWPGASGVLTTWDGLSATLENHTLRVASTAVRPLEIHLLQRHAEMDAPAGANVRYDSEAHKTVIVYERFVGKQSFTWKEGAQ